MNTATANGRAAAAPTIRVLSLGWRDAALALALQAAMVLVAVVLYVEGIRSDQREFKAAVCAELQSIDRRLSKLDGVPR